MRFTRRSLVSGAFAVVAGLGLSVLSASSALAETYAVFNTNKGTFKAKLFDDKVPNTVANFVGLAEGTKAWKDPKTGKMVKKPFYNGLIFHRIIDGFMIQGGCPEGTGYGGPGYKFADEFGKRPKQTKAGLLSMANSRPNTKGRPVFVTLGPTPHLNGRHTVFGEVVSGMDVVNAIGKVRTGEADRPVTPVVIKELKIEHGN